VHRVTRWLEARPVGLLTAYAALTAFTTYFCMYSFRKPFAAAHYAGESVGAIDLKSALIIASSLGYAVEDAGHQGQLGDGAGRQAWALVLLIVWAEVALVAFAGAAARRQGGGDLLQRPAAGRTVWGVVFSFLEVADLGDLGAGLSCAYVVASGVVKSIGAALLKHGVSEA
jgi:hypothetical protein